MGYVVKQGGKYLCQQETLTHTGAHVFETWTEDLNKATVFYDPRKKHLFVDGVKFIEAVETRTVTLATDHSHEKGTNEMSERTIEQLVGGLNSADPDFEDCTDAASMLLRQHADTERLVAERDAAIATAVLAERNDIVEQLRKWAVELSFDRTWSWKTPDGLLYWVAEMVSDRPKP